ncbi:putative reverse transcriptase domain-containing protein [Tanacetum coccineum]
MKSDVVTVFVSSAFTPFIDIAPTALNTSYEVELADGKVISTNTVLRDCYEKIGRIPLPNGEILEVKGERPEKDPGSLACIKADEKKLDDIRVVQDFPKVFPDDLSGLPPKSQFLGHVVNRDGIHVIPSKEKLCNAPVLALPDGPDDFVVYCDASKQGFGAADAAAKRERDEIVLSTSTTKSPVQSRSRKIANAPKAWIELKNWKHMAKLQDHQAPAKWLRGVEEHTLKRRDYGGIYFIDL